MTTVSYTHLDVYTRQADGLVPYKDFNMVPMPGLFMICAVVFKIFGNQLIVMRFLAVILMSVIFFMGYRCV